MRDIQIVNVINGAALNIGNRKIFTDEFATGPGYYMMKMRVGITLAVGTGTGAIAEGELRFVKNITMRTDKGELLCNLPGRALYKIAVMKSGALPRKDAIAAANGTYYVDIPLWFVDQMLMRPEDTILDTNRYNSITLEVTCGTVADLLTSVGTAAVTATLDVEVEQSMGLLPSEALPIAHIGYGYMPPVDASVTTTINLDKSSDLFYKRLITHASANGSAGEPFSGTNADDVQNLESIEDQAGFIVKQRVHEMIQNRNKDDYSLESVIAGSTIFDFVPDGSMSSALWSGDKAKLAYSWNNKAGVAAGDIVTVAYEGYRTLRP